MYYVVELLNEELKIIKSYSYYLDAVAFLEIEKKSIVEKIKRYNEYVEDYVNAINMPETIDISSWSKFIEQYPIKPCTSPSDFKDRLKTYLSENIFKKEGFNPPCKKTKQLYILSI